MMDEAYDPKHKASSVTSTTSTSTNGTAPSLFSGTSSVGGGDLDDFGAIEGNNLEITIHPSKSPTNIFIIKALDPTASLSIPADEDYFFLTKQDEQCIQPPAQDILDKFFDMQSLVSRFFFFHVLGSRPNVLISKLS